MRILAGGFTALFVALIGSGVSLHSQSGLDFIRIDHPAIGAPRSIVSADFNRDGFPDVALGGTTRASIGILYHHGLEDGDEGQRFGPVQEIVVGGGPFELATGDLNRDGLVDIAVANADLHAVTILLNDAHQTFNSIVHVPVAENPRGLAIADFNRDGIPDVAVSKYMGTSFDVLYGAGNGTFPTRRTYPAPLNAQGVAAADFNNDGTIDVGLAAGRVVSRHFMDSAGGATRHDVYMGEFVWNVIAPGDFNRDGVIDLAVASTLMSVVNVLFQARSGGASYSQSDYPVAASPRGIAAGDVNGDGWLDLVVAGRAESTATVLIRNPPQWGSAGDFIRHDFAAGHGARDVALADLDDDGRLDIVTANEYASSATLLSNRTVRGVAGMRMAPFDLPNEGDARVFAVADFDHNGKADILKSRFVYFDGIRPSRALVQPGTGVPSNGTAADFNRDGHLDAALNESGGFRVYLGDGAGNFSDAPRTSVPGGAWQMRTADLNRDGRADMVFLSIGGTTPGSLRVYAGRGDATFTAASAAPIPASARAYELGDLDRDGITDAVVTSEEGVHVFLGDGNGGWRTSVDFEPGVPRSAIGIGDVTSDGIPDLVLSDMDIFSWGITWSSRLTIARGNGDGSFEVIRQIDLREGYISSYVISLLLTDLDDNGELDIFTSSGHFLSGSGNGSFSDPAPFRPQGNWGLMAADFNGDGLTDILGVTDYDGSGRQIVMLNSRTTEPNRPPQGVSLSDTVSYRYAKYFEAEDEPEITPGLITDPDLHQVRLRWVFPDGRTIVTSRWGWAPGPEMTPGTYQMTLIVDDYRGGIVTKPFTLVMTPHKENVLYARHDSVLHGNWQIVDDPTAAGGQRLWHPNARAPKLQAPLANPVDYIDIGFLADPTQDYKLWIRMKAQDDDWSNDSVYVQFTGAADAAGNPVYEIGTTSALAVNLEECVHCGVSGWGWEDDGWGTVDRNGVTLRFPAGGRQRIRIQTREDGVSIDQIVLSGEKYKTARPGAAKNDNTKLNPTGPIMGSWWF